MSGKPVDVQDIYGELMDCIYLAQKFSKPLVSLPEAKCGDWPLNIGQAWESWVAVRQVVDYVMTQVGETDLSIWEVRGQQKNFLYSKVMMWCVPSLCDLLGRPLNQSRVALDRGLRLADKRDLPCPNRLKWLEARDNLYEDIQTNGWK